MKLSSLLCLLPLAKAKVIEATDSDLANYLYQGVPTILDLYASWCGHCKTFSPVFDELASQYEHLGDHIQFIKIDGDKNRKAAARFEVEYFPTIKFIDADDNIEEIDSRDIKSLRKLIKNKVGVTPDTPASEAALSSDKGAEKKEQVQAPKVSREQAESTILSLIDDDFEENIRGKNALVSFTTQWCSYCKSLAPEWEKLAQLYSKDDEITIANVDCSDMELTYSLTEVFNVEAFPTIMYFSEDEEYEPSQYDGKRDFNALVEFVRSKGISHRTASGKLDEKAGVLPLDLSVLPDYNALLEQVKDTQSKYAPLYTKTLQKAAADPNYLARESKRLSGIIETATLSPSDLDSFTIRLNIVNSLIVNDVNVKKTEDVKEEL